MPAATVVCGAGQPITTLLFPIRSVVSIVVLSTSGIDVEASLIGRDGLFGLSAILGDDEPPLEAVVQIADSMWSIPKAAFIEVYRTDVTLTERIGRFAQYMILCLSQLAACNRLHDVNERCARWLLMGQDRTLSDALRLTQEFLATMLGTRRPVVSLATATLARAGYIATTRGRVTVIDREGLEAAACECYAVMNENCRRLLSYDVQMPSR